MSILGITVLMIIVIIVGRSNKEMGLKQRILIGLFTLMEVCIEAFEMYTKSPPPLH